MSGRRDGGAGGRQLGAVGSLCLAWHDPTPPSPPPHKHHCQCSLLSANRRAACQPGMRCVCVCMTEIALVHERNTFGSYGVGSSLTDANVSSTLTHKHTHPHPHTNSVTAVILYRRTNLANKPRYKSSASY